MAAASLLAAVPTVRAANVFFDQNAATIGTSGTGAWDATSAFWVNAGTGTSIPGNVAGAAYTFTNADTAYFIGQSGTITGSASVTASGRSIAWTSTSWAFAQAIACHSGLNVANGANAARPGSAGT